MNKTSLCIAVLIATGVFLSEGCTISNFGRSIVIGTIVYILSLFFKKLS